MRILVSAAGGDVTQAITRIIKRNYSDAFIIGTDVNPEPFASNLVDKFLILPRADHENYLLELSRILIEYKIDLLIPGSEPEIREISNSSLKLNSQILKVSKLAVETFLDKFKTYQFLSLLGDFAPQSELEFDEKYLGFPCLIKPRFGRGSSDIHICSNKTEVEFYSRRIQNPFFQEILEPSDMEITCGVYRSASGYTQVIQLHRKLVEGRTSWAKVIYDEKIDFLCKLVAEKIDLVGSINIQLINTNSGPKIFEVNPRYSSTVEMRDLLGFNDLVWRINEILFNQEPGVFTPKIGSLVGKVDSSLIFSNSDQK